MLATGIRPAPIRAVAQHLEDVVSVEGSGARLESSTLPRVGALRIVMGLLLIIGSIPAGNLIAGFPLLATKTAMALLGRPVDIADAMSLTGLGSQLWLVLFILGGMLGFVSLLLTAGGGAQLLDPRPLRELGLGGGVVPRWGWLVGIALGALWFAAGVGLLAARGQLALTPIQPLPMLLGWGCLASLAMLPFAASEGAVARAFVPEIVRRRWGVTASVAVATVLGTVLRAGHPYVFRAPAALLPIFAGVLLLVALTHRFRSAWPGILAHAVQLGLTALCGVPVLQAGWTPQLVRPVLTGFKAAGNAPLEVVAAGDPGTLIMLTSVWLLPAIVLLAWPSFGRAAAMGDTWMEAGANPVQGSIPR